MTRNLFFICNALDDRTRLERGIVTDSPAASRKVFMLTKAMRDVGVNAFVLSLGRGRQDGSGRFFSAKAVRVNGVPVIYLPFLHKRIISELFSLFFLIPVLWRLRKKKGIKTTLFYNRMPAYMLALFYSRLLGYRSVLDLEDGATNLKGWSLSSIGGRFFRWQFDSLCSHGALLACQALSKATKIRPVQCCYGTSEIFASKAVNKSSLVTVLLGGTVSADTGAPLLVNAINLLRDEEPAWARNVQFEITGKGDTITDFEQLAVDVRPPAVIVHGRTTDDEYRQILDRTYVGLALKPIAGKFADTTFPSKVIEFASRGILVITTDISDVRAMLTDDAIYLTADDARQLVDKLEWVVENREKADVMARNAADTIASICAPHVVGRNLADFLFRSNNGART